MRLSSELHMDILPDVLAPQLKLVFCGTAASTISAARGAYYANPGNRFWYILAETGLTPRRFQPEEFPLLLTQRIGLTDLAKQAVGADRTLVANDFAPDQFWQKIDHYQPEVLAFTSKTAAAVALGKPTQTLSYGRYHSRDIPICWVLPSPSGAARSYWNPQEWQALADFIRAE